MIFGPQAGIVIDASALIQLRGSLFLRLIIERHAAEERPVVIPSEALFTAAMNSTITASGLMLPGIYIMELTPSTIDSIVTHVRTLGIKIDNHLAHVLYESHATGGFPIVTASPETYENLHLPEPPELITLP